MNANPASPEGELAMVPEGGVEPEPLQFGALVWPALLGMQPVARVVALGPRYGLPPYQAPLVRMLASGRVTGPPLATSPKGATCSGLL
jgi:hypothetical protein